MAGIVNKVYTPSVQLCSQGPLPLVPRSGRGGGGGGGGDVYERKLGRLACGVLQDMGSLCVLFLLRMQQEGCKLYCQTRPLARFTDTHQIGAPHYYRQFTLSLVRKALKSTSIPGSLAYPFSLARSLGTGRREPWERGCPYIFAQFNPLNTGTPLIRTLTMAPSVSFLTDFDSILVCLWQRLY